MERETNKLLLDKKMNDLFMEKQVNLDGSTIISASG
jgi:hypothetical protein